MGNIFFEGYHHVGADNELFYRLKKKRLVIFCPQAKIIHHHPFTPTKGTAAAPMDEHYAKINAFVEADRRLLHKRGKELGFGPRIAAFCITHNNEGVIEEFVRENLRCVDEIYISDNLSTDRTMEVAQAAGAKVRQSGLVHSPENYNEGETKQKALDFAMESSCEWMMYLDSDEILEGKADSLSMVGNLQHEAYGMRIATFWLDRIHYRIDGTFGKYMSHPYPLKLWRRDIGVKFAIPPRGCHSYPMMPPGHSYVPTSIIIKHYSFPDREAALRKYEYYRRADPEGLTSGDTPHYEHLHPDYPGVSLLEWGHPYPVLESVIRPGGLVFDIGANVGQSTAVFREIGARVIAVEPNPYAAAQIANDVVVRKACGEKTGSVILRLPNGDAEKELSVLATTIQARADCDYYRSTFSEGGSIEADMVTLDVLIAEYGIPSYIKIDVEGAEPSVLKGLSHPVKNLSFEIIGMQPDWQECFDLMERLGKYEYNIVRGETWDCLMPWGDKEGVIRYFKENAGFRDYFDVYCRLVT